MKILGISGGIHKTAPVSQVPLILLSGWRVFELPDGDRHLVGYDLGAAEGRVSSKLTEWNAKTRQARTRTGRTYELVGHSSFNWDADYVWKRWCELHRIQSYREVSEEYVGRTTTRDGAT